MPNVRRMFSADIERFSAVRSSLSKETVNRGLRHIVRSRLRLSNYYQFQDTWLIQKLWEHATCKLGDLCVSLLLPSKTSTSHAHSSLASFHPNPPRPSSLYSATRLAPPGHFSYHAAARIICGCMHGTVSYGARLIPLRRELSPRRRQGIASKFVVLALSNKLADMYDYFFIKRAMHRAIRHWTINSFLNTVNLFRGPTNAMQWHSARYLRA